MSQTHASQHHARSLRQRLSDAHDRMMYCLGDIKSIEKEQAHELVSKLGGEYLDDAGIDDDIVKKFVQTTNDTISQLAKKDKTFAQAVIDEFKSIYPDIHEEYKFKIN